MIRRLIVALALVELIFPQDKSAKEPEWVEITPERVKPEEATRVLKIEDRLKFEIGFSRRSYGTKEGVTANCHIHNPTKKTLNATLHVAVFDKNKRLISTSRLSWEGTGMIPAIKAGEKDQSTGLSIEAPSQDLDRIKYVQARLYVWE